MIAALAGQRIAGGQKIRLHEIACARIAAAGHDEQIVHAAVGDAVRLHEARLADGSVLRFEPRNRIDGAVGVRDADQGILRRAAAADIGKQMAGRALVRIEARTQAIARALRGASTAHDFDEIEACHAVLKEINLVRAKPRQRAWRPLSVAA